MVEIQLHDIKKLDYIGSGKFGLVYKKDNHVAYKIYHDFFELLKMLATFITIFGPRILINLFFNKCN